MTEVNDQMLGEMARIIAQEADADRVVLFGSRARGDAQPHSDVDLMVIEKMPFGPGRSRRREMIRLRDALSGFRLSIDVLTFSREEVEFWRDSMNHVIARAFREGRTLYARS